MSTSWERRRSLLIEVSPGRQALAGGPGSPASQEELSSLSVSGCFGSSLSLASIVRRKSLEAARGLASSPGSFSPPPRRQRSRPPSSPVTSPPTRVRSAVQVHTRAVLAGWAREAASSASQRRLLAAVRTERLAAVDGLLRLPSFRTSARALSAALLLLGSAFRTWARRGEVVTYEKFPIVGSQRARRVSMLARCHAGWQVEAVRTPFSAWYTWLCEERLCRRSPQHQVALLLEKQARLRMMQKNLALWRLAIVEAPALEARRKLELCKNESSTVKFWNGRLSAEVETLRAEVERLSEELSAATLVCDHNQSCKSTFSILSPKAGEELFGHESFVQCVDESMDAPHCLWSELSDSVIKGPGCENTAEGIGRDRVSIRQDSLIFSPSRTGDCSGAVCAVAAAPVLARTCQRIHLLAWRSQVDLNGLLRLMLEQGTHADDAARRGRVLAGWRSVVERGRRCCLALRLLQAVDSWRSVLLLRGILCEWRCALSVISRSMTSDSAPCCAWHSARSRELDLASADSSALSLLSSSPATGRGGCPELFHSAKLVSPTRIEDRLGGAGQHGHIRVLLPAPSVSPSSTKKCSERGELFCPVLMLPAPTLSPGATPLASAWRFDSAALRESPRGLPRRMPSPSPRDA